LFAVSVIAMSLSDLPAGQNNATVSCFALLDDRNASDAEARSRLYTGYIGKLECRHASALPSVLEAMQQALQQGQHAVGLFSYELGEELHGITPRNESDQGTQILLFEHCEHMSVAQVEQWLTQREQATQKSAGNAEVEPAGIAQIRASVTEDEFAAAIARIHAYIEAGDTYQVNYTYRMHFDAFGSLYALYRRLRARQPVPYGALIALPDQRAVLSFSPELFMQYANGELLTRPMKGTALATGNSQEDVTQAAALSADPKNRAENVMIVDLLRNDLGRIAKIGSVQVPHLFEVQRYSSVLQMTSTVQARLRDDVSLTDIFAALYPCGSITGAPKRRTMQIIRELEQQSRGLYTGAIGWFDAPQQQNRIGDFCVSVPIRTLMLQAPEAAGVRHGEMGVGAGIVHDSKAKAEYEECQLKAQFLTGLRNDFELFETMQATHREGCRHLELHLQRLCSSAAYFGFVCDQEKIRKALQSACDALPVEGVYRMRLALNQAGECAIQHGRLLPWRHQPVRVLLASEPTRADDVFLRHKTTVRDRYDAAWRAAEAKGAFDMLFHNTRGELTEGARTNLFLKLNGRWYTPPLSAGVLPGIMRTLLLQDPGWAASERILTLDDLRVAEDVVICNALRGVLHAQVDWSNMAAMQPANARPM
jgi:para-aminobenzoate synthetase/4-amino-4-deoxychorismate lyase